ncbi:MAG: single-stranded-DNA-specific exonuclease RecJ [Anaerolinea sp.]|nr:single-stranded-DNA-specific exonuclease RecJ [Anaerolinea sp.]
MPSTQQKKWWVYPVIPPEIDIQFQDFPKYIRQILFNRGIADVEAASNYLNASAPIHDPFLLLDMDRTVDRLLQAIDQHEGIVVYGDYDVDGVSATALMVQVLQKLDANVFRFIPNRFDEGYGLNNESISMLADSGAKVILTVDCGIRSPREADHAKLQGIDLIISDHHHPKDDLPQAYAIVCPKREGDPFPYKDLAGVGLAYKIAQALFLRRSAGDWTADDFLDLVALGTVADIVPLTGENRTLVRRGINQIRMGNRIGIKALAGAAAKEVNRITATDIGFILGPRLNAAGRMDSALKAYDILVTDSIAKAGLLAQELDNQNNERQKATKAAQDCAKDSIGEDSNLNLIPAFFKVPSEDEPNVRTNGYLPGEDIYPGIVGLVAAKLTEYYYRPAIAGVVEKDYCRASCRSIPEFHITEALDECSDLLVRHGGHAMAAGFTVKIENLSELVTKLSGIADRQLGQQELKQMIRVDCEVPVGEITPGIYRDLESLQPTGMSNPSAAFVARNVKFSDMKTMGKESTHLRCVIEGSPINQAVAFNQAHWYNVWKDSKSRFDIVYSIEINRYFEKETQQINIRDMHPSE